MHLGHENILAVKIHLSHGIKGEKIGEPSTRHAHTGANNVEVIGVSQKWNDLFREDRRRCHKWTKESPTTE